METEHPVNFIKTHLVEIILSLKMHYGNSNHIERVLGISLTPKNSYARIYYNDGVLGKHVDREGLKYTLSITLFSNLDNDWPLWCIDKKGTETPISIKPGDGALMVGTQLTHWREPLICNDDQFVVQLFMHWA